MKPIRFFHMFKEESPQSQWSDFKASKAEYSGSEQIKTSAVKLLQTS